MWILAAKLSFSQKVDDDVCIVLDEECIIDIFLVGFEVKFFFVPNEGMVLGFGHEP